VADLLLNITSNYKFVGFDILPSYGIFNIFKEGVDIPAGMEEYKHHLEKYCQA
jgi:modulator of drug activity B